MMRRTALVLALLVVPSALHAQTAVDRLTLDSKVLGETRIVLVKTPVSYGAGDQRYPVIYMTDGGTQLGHTAATVDFLAREGRMPEVIVVGIGNTDRTRDLTPTRLDSTILGGQQLRFPTSGGSEKFLAFIETELIPHIETKYRTRPYRLFTGHSFGGLFALHTFITRPRLFNAIIAVSPALTWDDNLINRKLPEFLKNNRELNTSLFVTVGNEGAELDESLARFHSLIEANRPTGLEFGTLKLGDEDHGSLVLPSHYAGLKHAFAGWRFALTPADDPTKLLARATDHYARLSKRMGYSVVVPEPTANLIGYRLLQVNKIPEAIEVLRMNADMYPLSANAYDSLGEAYERGGSLDLARGYYERASKLGKENADPNTAVYEQNRDRVAKELAKAKPASSTDATRARALTMVASLGGLVELDGKLVKRIDLSSTETTDAHLDALSDLTELRELDLRITQVTDAGVERLRKLSLFRNDVTDGALTNLRQLQSLEVLLISGSKISETGAAELQKAIPGLKFTEQT